MRKKPKIFISYRRDDSPYVAKFIYDQLTGKYGNESVTFDVDSIPKGIDFVKYLNQQVGECDIMLAIIGDRWLDTLKQRIDDRNDFVRIEIEAALKRKIPVIPVLIDSASMPSADQLSDDLKPLHDRNVSSVTSKMSDDDPGNWLSIG